jgi:hypothetical protein
MLSSELQTVKEVGCSVLLGKQSVLLGKECALCYLLSRRNVFCDSEQKYRTLFLPKLLRTVTVFFSRAYGKMFTACD